MLDTGFSVHFQNSRELGEGYCLRRAEIDTIDHEGAVHGSGLGKPEGHGAECAVGTPWSG